jgi:methionyl-tRNA synthetase
VIATAARVHENVMKWIAEVKLSQVVEEIMSLVRTVNRYLEIKAPWKLAMDPAKRTNSPQCFLSPPKRCAFHSASCWL